MGDFFQKLRRRNIFRVAGAYIFVGWILIQFVVAVETPLSLPDWTDTLCILLLVFFFPVAMICAWAFELTPEGVKRTAAVPEGQSIARKTGRKLDYFIIVGLALVAVLIVAQAILAGLETEQIVSDSQAGSKDNNPSRMSPKIPPTSKTAEIASWTERLTKHWQLTAIGGTVVFLIGSVIWFTNRKRLSADSAQSVVEFTNSTTTLAKSIAVLPFVNRSSDPGDASFTDGIHDDLLTQLAKIDDMHVISRTSVLRYAETDRSMKEIAGELCVATVMQGGVQRAGSRVLINVQLIDAVLDAHIWAERYDRELTVENIFDIQKEITIAIANALQSVLTRDDEAELAEMPTKNLTAYEAFIRGNTLFKDGSLTKESLVDSIAAYDEAIAVDPDFAAAYAAKAQAQLRLYWNFDPGNKNWITIARTSIDQAEALAPENIETLIVRAYYHYWGFLDYKLAGTFIERALLKAPNNAQVLALKGFVARRAGWFDKATQALETAHQLDPLDIFTPLTLADVYLPFGQFDKARTIIDRTRGLNPTNEDSVWASALYWYYRGEPERAWTVIAAVEPRPNWTSFALMRLFYAYFTRDCEKIDFALETVPAAQPGNATYRESFNIRKALALELQGKMDESRRLIQEICARTEMLEDPYPGGWSEHAPYSPVILPGLMRDLGGIRAAVAELEANAVPDAAGALIHQFNIAVAFARADAPDAALDHIDKITKVAGPSVYLRMKIDPAFDNLRDHLGYAVAEGDYKKWAAENGYA